MHALYPLGAIACFVLAICIGKAAWDVFRTPEKIFRAHQQLTAAVRALNKGTATPEQQAIVDDARKLGMVSSGFSVAKSGGLRMHHYVTRTARRYLAEGQYPTTASIDAELEEFRIG